MICPKMFSFFPRKNDLPVQIQGFLKIVEDFHNICDQVQIWLVSNKLNNTFLV